MAKKKDEIKAEEPDDIEPAEDIELEDGEPEEAELAGFHDPIVTRPAAKKDTKEAELDPDKDAPAPETTKPPAFSVVKTPDDQQPAADQAPSSPAQAPPELPPAESSIAKQLQDAYSLITQQGAQIRQLSEVVQRNAPAAAPAPTVEESPQEPTQDEWDTDAMSAMKKHDAVIEHRMWQRYQGHQQEQTQTQRFQSEVQHWDSQAATHIPDYHEIGPKADLLMRTAATNPNAGLRGIDKVPAGKFLVSLVEAVFSGKLVPAGQAQPAPAPALVPQPAAETPAAPTASNVLEQSRLRRIAAGQSAPPTPNKRAPAEEITLTQEQEDWVKLHNMDRTAYARQVGLLNKKRKTA